MVNRKGGDLTMLDSNIASIGYDITFEMNEFNQPKLKSEIELVKDVILYILFSKPGQYPSLPDIGLDIQSILYSFFDELDAEDLKAKLRDQCEALGVFLNNGSIEIKKTRYKDRPSLIIGIQGKVSYPTGYLKTTSDNIYLIGITLDELNKLLYDISNEKVGD